MSEPLGRIEDAIWAEWADAKFYGGSGLMLARTCALCELPIGTYTPFYEQRDSLHRWAHADCVEPAELRRGTAHE